MTTEPSRLSLASPGLSVEVATLGAELQDLCDADGRRVQWDGDPAVWAGRAPLLFPIVGMLRDDAYRLDGRTYTMHKHGFARRSRFDVVSHDASSALLRLTPNDETRACYPFDFRLDVRYALRDATLEVVATVANDGDRPMPASFGFHPAFRWPLPYDQPRDEHTIRFEHDEPAPIRRIDGDGLLTPEPHPTPVVGRVLTLRDAYFDDDALIFDRLTSRRVSYGAARGPRIDVRFDGFTTLGVWTKPGGARFICIEPWHGRADPVGFDGDLWQKPGILTIEPGGERRFVVAVSVVPQAAA